MADIEATHETAAEAREKADRFNTVFESATEVRKRFVGDGTKALRPWSKLDLEITRAIMAERERCARIVEKGLGQTNTTIARAIRNGDAP